jgi:hypothetical protein
MISLPTRKVWPALLALAALILVGAGCKDFFTDPKLTSIAVTPTTSSIALSDTTQLSATGTYNDSSTKDITQSVNWAVTSSTPTGAATVGNTAGTKGKVTGVLAGTATIQASATGATSGTASVTIGLTLTSITVTPADSTISKTSTGTQQFTATAHYSDGVTTQNLTNSVTWTASTNDVMFSSTTPGLGTINSVPTTNPITITATSSAATGSVAGTTTLTINP